MMNPEPKPEHRWLQKMVGDWTCESECVMAPGEPPVKGTATESVRALGGLWVLCEGINDTPGGTSMISIMTLGFDPAKNRFVGTFVASCMTHLWTYDGQLDPAGKVLTLDAVGPGFSPDGKLANYKDRIEFKSDDHRVLTSTIQMEDGSWVQFMTAHYRKVK